MNWIGGTQSPLVHGYLRAAANRRWCTETDVVDFDVHDVDTAGLQVDADDRVSIFPGDKAWHPLYFDRFLAARPAKLKLQGTVSHPIVIRGLTMGRANVAQTLRDHLQAQVDHAAGVARSVGFVSESEVVGRGTELLEVAGSILRQPKATWSDFCKTIGRFVLGSLLDGVSMETTGSHLAISQLADHPEYFSVLTRFLQDEALRRQYGKMMGKDDSDHLPYFLVYQQDGEVVRLPFSLSSGAVFVGSERLGALRELTSAESVAAAVQSAGFLDPILAPKAVPLFAQLSFAGTVFGKKTEYHGRGARLLHLLGHERPRFAVVTFDTAKALGRKEWRGFCRFLHQSDEPRRYDVPKGACGAVDHHWQRKPSLIGSWLIGGNHLLERLVATSSVTVEEFKRAKDLPVHSVRS